MRRLFASLLLLVAALSGAAAQSTMPGSRPVLGDSASLSRADQVLQGGANVISYAIGTVSTGTYTVDCGLNPLQYYTNGGAHTLAAPAQDGSCIVLTTNNASAGTITFSGFTEGTNKGDTLDTTNAHVFAINIFTINGKSHYLVSAYQ
jgi:hypothetical protein